MGEALPGPKEKAMATESKGARRNLGAELLEAAADGDGTRLWELRMDGAKLDVCDKNGWAPLHLAVHSGSIYAVEILLSNFRADPNAATPRGSTPLLLASNGHLASKGGLDIVQSLLAAGADPNLEDECGATPLHTAAASHPNHASLNSPSDIAACANSAKIVKALLAAGGAPSARDQGGATPLFAAAGGGYNVEAVLALIEAGADPNVATRYGWASTPLHAAAEADSVENVQALLAAGADPDVRDYKGRLPEDVANGKAKDFLDARRQALSEEGALLDCLPRSSAPARSSAL